MTTIDRDELRDIAIAPYVDLGDNEHEAMHDGLLDLLNEVDALQAIHRDALSHARRIIAHPDRWHHQDLVDATSNLLSALKGAPTVRDGATQWRDRAARAEAQSETRRQQTAYWQERAEGFEARIQAVRRLIDKYDPHPEERNPFFSDGGPMIETAILRRALDGDT